MKEKLRRGMFMPLVASALGLIAFFRMPGSENVRAVQMLSLIAVGMGLGVALAHIKILLGMKSDQ